MRWLRWVLSLGRVRSRPPIVVMDGTVSMHTVYSATLSAFGVQDGVVSVYSQHSGTVESLT